MAVVFFEKRRRVGRRSQRYPGSRLRIPDGQKPRFYKRVGNDFLDGFYFTDGHRDGRKQLDQFFRGVLCCDGINGPVQIADILNSPPVFGLGGFVQGLEDILSHD